MISNDEVAAMAQAYPGRILGVASSNLHKPMEAVRELCRAVKELRFRGLRIVPWLWNLPPNDRRYYPPLARGAASDQRPRPPGGKSSASRFGKGGSAQAGSGALTGIENSRGLPDGLAGGVIDDEAIPSHDGPRPAVRVQEGEPVGVEQHPRLAVAVAHVEPLRLDGWGSG
jgi:hypothetical protein